MKVDLDEFYSRWIEGYLLGDLEAMAAIKPTSNLGGVGYPILGTTLAGMELLGYLLYPQEKNLDWEPKDGTKVFHYFWKRYFAAAYPIPYTGAGTIFRGLVRNGIAHTFMGKGKTWVTRDGVSPTLIDHQEQSVRVDCVRFFREFEQVCETRVRPIVNETAQASLTTRACMEERLNGLIAMQKEEVNKAFQGSHLKRTLSQPAGPAKLPYSGGTALSDLDSDPGTPEKP